MQSAHWDPTQAGGWSAWTNILPGFLTPGTPITAVSRAPGFIDIFCIGNDGIALTGGHSPADGWGGFWRLTATVPVNPLAPTSPAEPQNSNCHPTLAQAAFEKYGLRF